MKYNDFKSPAVDSLIHFFISRMKFPNGSYVTQLSCYDNYLKINDDWVSEFEKDTKGVSTEIRCNLIDKKIRIFKNDEELKDVSTLSLYNGIIDLNSNGDRWEGSIVDGMPCGYGYLFDEDNNLIYKGFYYVDKRVCYGISYYGDSQQIEYEGFYFNNMRHGPGEYFDNNGKLISKGYWKCDMAVEDDISTGCEWNRVGSSIVTFITRYAFMFKGNRDFVFRDYPRLSTIQLNYCNEAENIVIEDCSCLESVFIKTSGYRSSGGTCRVANCPNLNTLYFDNSFDNYVSCEILSIFSFFCFIRFTQTRHIVC